MYLVLSHADSKWNQWEKGGLLSWKECGMYDTKKKLMKWDFYHLVINDNDMLNCLLLHNMS